MKKIFLLLLFISSFLLAQDEIKRHPLWIDLGSGVATPKAQYNIYPFGNQLGNLGATANRWNFLYTDTTITNHLANTTWTFNSVAITATGTQLNYLGGATGTTGTGNLVYSIAPALTGVASVQDFNFNMSADSVAAFKSLLGNARGHWWRDTTSVRDFMLDFSGDGLALWEKPIGIFNDWTQVARIGGAGGLGMRINDYLVVYGTDKYPFAEPSVPAPAMINVLSDIFTGSIYSGRQATGSLEDMLRFYNHGDTLMYSIDEFGQVLSRVKSGKSWLQFEDLAGNSRGGMYYDGTATTGGVQTYYKNVDGNIRWNLETRKGQNSYFNTENGSFFVGSTTDPGTGNKFTVTGTTGLAGNLSLLDPGTSANSYVITLTADNATTPQYGTIQVNNGADPYLRLSAPNDAGTATAIMDLKDQRVVIGSSAAGVDYDIYLQGETNQGTITYMEDEDRFDVDNDFKVGASLWGSAQMSGTDAFTTTATTDTVTVSGATVNDIYTLTYITAVTAAEAVLSVTATATGFIATRSDGTTSAASYTWTRQRK